MTPTEKLYVEKLREIITHMDQFFGDSNPYLVRLHKEAAQLKSQIEKESIESNQEIVNKTMELASKKCGKKESAQSPKAKEIKSAMDWDNIEKSFFTWSRSKWCPTHEQIFDWFKEYLNQFQPELPSENKVLSEKEITDLFYKSLEFSSKPYGSNPNPLEMYKLGYMASQYIKGILLPSDEYIKANSP